MCVNPPVGEGTNANPVRIAVKADSTAEFVISSVERNGSFDGSEGVMKPRIPPRMLNEAPAKRITVLIGSTASVKIGPTSTVAIAETDAMIPNNPAYLVRPFETMKRADPENPMLITAAVRYRLMNTFIASLILILVKTFSNPSDLSIKAAPYVAPAPIKTIARPRAEAANFTPFSSTNP